MNPLSECFQCLVHLLFHFFLNFVNRAGRIWLSHTYCDVMLKRSQMLWGLTWETLAWKNIKKQKRLAFHLKELFLLKNIVCPYFSPIAKLWSRKKVIFKVFIFWRYSKTLKKNINIAESFFLFYFFFFQIYFQFLIFFSLTKWNYSV